MELKPYELRSKVVRNQSLDLDDRGGVMKKFEAGK
jgi:hypothetical protein